MRQAKPRYYGVSVRRMKPKRVPRNEWDDDDERDIEVGVADDKNDVGK